MQHLDDGALAALLDGEADGQTVGRSDGQRHLDGCAECQARLEEMRVTRERARAILRSATPSGSQPAFQEILRRRQANKADARRLANLRPLAWAATVVLALGVGWYARELSMREASAGGPIAATEAAPQPRTAATALKDSAPARAYVRSQPRQLARREEQAKETGNVRAKVEALAQNDAPPAAPVVTDRLAAQPPSRQLAVAEDERLKKARDTMPLSLDAVVVTGAAQGSPAAAGGRAQEAERSDRRARAAAPAAAPSAVLGRASVNLSANLADWIPVDAAQASQVLGRAPLTAPGLDVLAYQAAPRQPGTLRVTQRMGTGILELIEQRAGAVGDEQPSASRALTGPGVGGLVDGIQLRLWGPVSYDSLRALVGKLR